MNKQTIGVGIGAIGGFLACWLVVGMSGCNRGGDVLAVVNGETITMDDYYKYLELKPDVRVMTASGPTSLKVDGALGFQAMQDLIAQHVTMQLAKDRKIYPTDAEINQELEFKKKLNPNFLSQLTSNGLTFDMIRQSITIDLINEKLLTAGIKVSQADVDKYVKEHPQEFVEPARADLSWILVQDTNTQKQVDKELGAGQSFTQVGLRYSADPQAKATGCKLIDKANPSVAPAVTSLPPDIQKAIKGLDSGQSTDWIRLVDGYAKFSVNKMMPERAIVMDDTKKEYLRRLLAQNKGAQGRDLNRQILTKLKDSKVEVRKPAYQEPWKEAYKKFMTENKLEAITGSRG